MSRFKLGVCTLALAALAGAASASEPMPLTETQLDAVTAGTVEVGIFTSTRVGDTVFGPVGISTTVSDFLSVTQTSSDTDGNQAGAEIGGEVEVRGNNFFRAASGVFQGQTGTSGDAEATVGTFVGVTEGQPLVEETYVVDLGPNDMGGRDAYLIAVGASFDPTGMNFQ